MKSSDKFIYAKGKFSEGPECGSTDLELCLKASDLTDADSADDCNDLKVFTIPSLTVAQVASAADNAEKIISTPIEGIIDFIEESPNATE